MPAASVEVGSGVRMGGGMWGRSDTTSVVVVVMESVCVCERVTVSECAI